MCKNGKNSKKGVKQRDINTKNKRTCCERCRRRICIWFCRRIKRCIKRNFFKTTFDDFKITGFNLDNLKDNLKLNKSQDTLNKDKFKPAEKKPTVVTLYRNKKKSLKSITMKNKFIEAIDKYFVPQSLGYKIKSLISDFRERNFSLDLSKNSQLFLNKDEKSKLKNLANKYENKSALLKSYENLKKRIPLTASKSKIFRNMIDDYKKGTLSVSELVDKQITDISNMNDQDLQKVLAQYEAQKKKKSIFKNIDSKKIDSKLKKYSLTNLDLLKNMNSNELKNKFSLSDSKQKMLRQMIEDYKKGKISLTALQSNIKKDKNILSKENINQMLNYYKEHKSKSIVKQSKFKQLKSDLRGKFDFL